MDELLKYFTKKDNSLLLNKGFYMECYIPKEFFDSRLSTLINDTVETFGFLTFYIWSDKETDRSLSKAKKVKLRMPTSFITKPTRIIETTEHKVLEYNPDDKVFKTMLLEQSSIVVANYVRALLSGKLPDMISYDEIGKFWIDCAEINKVDINVNALYLDLIVMLVSRNPENLTEMFREALKNNPKIRMTSRKLINIDKIPPFTSQFGALSSGDPKYGISTSIGAVKSGEMKGEESDIEKTIK